MVGTDETTSNHITPLDHSSFSANITDAWIFRWIRIAPRYEPEVMAVIIHTEPTMTHIELVDPLRIEVTPQNIHVVRPGVFGVRVDPELGRRVLVPERRERQAGDGVLRRGDAVAFAGLLREEADGRGVADAGGTVAVELDVVVPPVALVADVPRGEDGQCASEGVAGDGDAVVRVVVVEFGEDFQGGFADASP